MKSLTILAFVCLITASAAFTDDEAVAALKKVILLALIIWIDWKQQIRINFVIYNCFRNDFWRTSWRLNQNVIINRRWPKINLKRRWWNGIRLIRRMWCWFSQFSRRNGISQCQNWIINQRVRRKNPN